MPCPHSAARTALSPRPPLVPAPGATAAVLRPAPTAMVSKTAPRARVPKTAPTAMVPWARGRWAEDENLENLEPLDHLENLENLDSRPPPRRRRHHRCRRRHHRRMRLRRCRGRRVEPRPRPPRRAHHGAATPASAVPEAAGPSEGVRRRSRPSRSSVGGAARNAREEPTTANQAWPAATWKHDRVDAARPLRYRPPGAPTATHGHAARNRTPANGSSPAHSRPPAGWPWPQHPR